MSKCDNCGRDDGHWLGCAEAAPPASFRSPVDDSTPPVFDACSLAGCSEPRRSADKRVKFCEFHSDPKNRK